MTTGAAHALGRRLLVILAGPLALAAAGALVPALVAGRTSPDERVLDYARVLEPWFDALARQGLAVADATLAESPQRVWSAAATASGLPARLEGLAILDAESRFEIWTGTPIDPPPGFTDPGADRIAVLAGGARTRLLARAGPDGAGRVALATFVLDSPQGDRSFSRLLPPAPWPGVDARVTLGAEPDPRGPAGARLVAWHSPTGAPLGSATLVALPAAHRAAEIRDRVWSLAFLALLVLTAAGLPWGRWCRHGVGLGAALSLLALARAGLSLSGAAARLLPRDLGTPLLYGSPVPFGLLASPGDLLASGLCLLLAGLAVRRRIEAALADSTPRALVALAAAAAAVAIAAPSAGIALSLARDARLDLLTYPAPFDHTVQVVLWSGLLLPLIATAELLGAAWSALARAAWRAPIAAAVALVPLVAGASALMQSETDRFAVEQLRSDWAPLVQGQAARRRQALAASLARLAPDLRGDRTYAAYRSWLASELYFGRHRSALDFYALDGTPVSRFAFGLPPLAEGFDPGAARRELTTEAISGLATRPQLLHAETVLLDAAGEIVGFATAHVLDEPENLPFLPWSQPYLDALGPGAGLAPAEGSFLGPLQYVLYDPAGNVELSTLLRPPAHGPAVRRAARRAEALEVLAGDEPHVAVPVEEHAGRLHLLLLPRRTPAERLAAAVRPGLLGLLLLALLGPVPGLLRPRGAGLAAMLRGSLRRKLLAAMLLASVVPLLALALFLRGYVERRGDADLEATAARTVATVQRVIEDYAAADPTAPAPELNDAILHWLSSVAGQEIQLYAGGRLEATSTRALFDSGLLAPRLDGEVRRRLVDEGLPHLVAPMALGPRAIPVAYAPVRARSHSGRPLVVAVPLVLEQRQAAREAARVGEMILLATVALVALLALVAAWLARSVSEPVRGLVAATARVAAGDYAARLQPTTQDEVAELVSGFNAMAQALGIQRDDLERRRDYIEAVLRHATAGVITLDVAGRIVTLNPAGAALLAACGARLQVGRPLIEALSAAPDLAPLSRALFEPPAPAGEPREIDLPRGREARRWRAVRVELADRRGGLGTLILLDDVTDLMRSNQLAAWAEMARAIAHEIKNPLTPIQLSAEHLRRLLTDRGIPATGEEQQCLDTVIKQVRALHDIAREFSTYAKLPALSPEPTDPTAFAREVLAPYRLAPPAGIRIEERYATAGEVALDRRVLGRALVNLIENALQAMARGGTLTLCVGPDATSRAVEIAVADTGPGLSPEVRRRLFEPYFSTKTSGTGLGLAIARRAIEAHGGTIDVETAPGAGTTFRIRLPLATADPAAAPPPGYTRSAP